MPRPKIQLIGCLFAAFAAASHADYLDDIGFNDLLARKPNLNGSGITMAQTEASSNGNWQVDPDNVGLNSSLFTYYQTSAPYPLGESFDPTLESGHANTVGGRLYTVAPGIDAAEIFEANYYYNTLIVSGINTDAKVINQSFVFSESNSTVDQRYDNYAASFGVLFVNGINTNVNPSTIPSPGSSYNGITVGTEDDTVTPPTDDRSKPEIVAPGSSLSSYTTPLVAGAATLLLQSAANEDAGTGTASDAADIRTIKALLLNGAAKPFGWSHTETRPLDVDSGAGILNINTSQLILEGGQHAATTSTSSASGSSHLPPSGITGNLSSQLGWNLSTLTNQRVSGSFQDTTDHYFFDWDASEGASFTLTATLTWWRQINQSDINNLDFFLYTEAGTLVASSISTVDNVEHILERNLLPGRYVLQVHKPASGRITNSEDYATAFALTVSTSPTSPGSVSVTTLSASEIQITWTDTSDQESGYRIERRISGGSYTEIATLDADTESYTDTTLDAASTYEYRVTAFNPVAEAATETDEVTTYTLLEDWRVEYFGFPENTGDAANTADPDNDTVLNLVEFAIGTDPTMQTASALDLTKLGSDQEAAFQWRTDAGIDFELGYTADLTTAFTYDSSATLDADASTALTPILPFESANGFETKVYRIRPSIDADRAFIRFRVNTVDP